MKKTAVPVLIFMASLLCACHNETIVCQLPLFRIAGVGFTAADFNDGSLIYRYKKDNAFDSLIDSTVLNTRFLNTDTETITMGMNTDYDYKVSLPATGAVYYITKITLTGNVTQTIQKGILNNEVLTSCYRPLASYVVNATTYAAATNAANPSDATIFVHK